MKVETTQKLYENVLKRTEMCFNSNCTVKIMDL